MNHSMNAKRPAGCFIPALPVIALLAAFISSKSLAAPAEGAPRVAISIVNYSELPVYAHAIALDLEPIRRTLGIAPGSPIAIHSAEGRRGYPAVGGQQDGKSVAWCYLSMKPHSRFDGFAEPAQGWADPSQLTAATSTPGQMSAQMCNGIVRFKLGPAGWALGFNPGDGFGIAPVRAANAPAIDPAKRPNADADPLMMIDKGNLQFWIDNQNRGRLTNGKPGDMGLVNFPASATLVKCESSVNPGGVPSIALVRRMSGLAKDITVTETFELLPGLPILICRIRWDNEGDAPLWVAYVGSGDGIKGSWGRTLMAAPLIERMKTPLKGYLNGAETRPAWNSGLAKVSMESSATGCGVGLSTLLPTPGSVGQGSMIWGVNGSGFQVNLIDPKVGQFPFEIKPHGKLENGNAFLLTQNGTSAYRQVVEVWTALAAGKSPRLASPCAVFVDGAPAAPQTVSDAPDLRPLMQRRGDSLVAALRMDFTRYYTCSGEVTIGDAPVEVIAHPLTAKARPIPLATLTRSGPFSLALNDAFPAADEVPFTLEFKRGAGAVTAFSITETLPVAPEPRSPLDNADITDIATMFRWRAIPLVVDYEIQWSRSPDFAAPVVARFAMSQDHPWYIPPKDQLPSAGKWHWRVRGVKGSINGAWSAPHSFTVNTDYARKPLVRSISADNPLFTLEASKWTPYTQFQSDMPAEIRPYVGIIVEGFIDKGLTIQEALAGVDKIPHPFLMRTHPPTQISLADIEWVCQNFPNFIGIQGGETIKKLYEPATPRTGDGEYHRRMVMLLAKYGRFFHEADGTYKDDAWQDLWDRQQDFLKEFGQYIVLTQKNNIIRRQFYTQSAVMGLWLGGITLAHGAWEDGGFYWQNAGFDGIDVCRGERSGKLNTMPRSFWSLMCAQGIARGCGIYSLDGQTLMESSRYLAKRPEGAWRSALWDDNYKTTDTFKRFLVPLIQATVKHHLVPTKGEVLRNVRLAVYNDKAIQPDALAWPHYMEYGPLFAGTYGFKKMGNIDGQLWEIFQNTGRYHFIPVLPQGNVPIDGTIENLPVSRLQNVVGVRERFNAAYPAWYEGDAFVEHVGDTLVILNANENTDTAQTYSVPLHTELVQSLSGKIEVHSFVVARVEDRGKQFWLQSNAEYADRATELAFKCSRKPDWQITPASAGKVLWDESRTTLSMKLNHQGGAVEVLLK